MEENALKQFIREAPHFEEQRFCVTMLRRKPKAVWDFVDGYGHVAIITKHGKDDCVILSLETYLFMTQFATDERTLQHRADVLELLRQRDEHDRKKNRR